MWDMLKPSNHLWSQILSVKYLQGSNIFLARKSKGSHIWNLIVCPSFNLHEDDNSIFMWSHDNVDKFGIMIPITMWII